MEKHLDIELIIFDMDGLMFDTERLSYQAWKEAADLYNYHIDQDLFEKTIGTNLTKTKEIYFDYFGSSFPFDLIKDERVKLSDKFVKINGVPIKNGLYELLAYLSLKNIKTAVATSTSRIRALNLLSLAQIVDQFDYILCGDEVENSKPNPEIFLKVASKLESKPSKCLVLEDSELGILAAHNAGMMPLMVPDLIEPSEDTQKLLYQRMNSLVEVKLFLEDVFQCL